MMEEIAYTCEYLSRLPFQGTISNWSYYSLFATELWLLFDEKWAFSCNGRIRACERKPYSFLLQINMKNNKMGPWALASWVSTLSAVRSFFVDKLFNFSPLSLLLLLRAAHNYEVDCEQIHIFSALFIFYSGRFCVSLDLPSPSWMPDPILASYIQSSQLPICNQVLFFSSEIFSVHRGCVLHNSVMLPSVQGLSLKTTLSLLHSLTSSYFALLPAFVRGARSSSDYSNGSDQIFLGSCNAWYAEWKTLQ